MYENKQSLISKGNINSKSDWTKMKNILGLINYKNAHVSWL